jgi:S1-C subfamily serine protease
LPGGESLPARLAGRDPGSDLAVLRVAASGLQAAVPTGNLAVGHLVLALGRPSGKVQATLGIVSALGDTPWQTPAGAQIDHYLQTDVVMYPGFSGGPLIDVAGHVLGLNTSALVGGVSLALPAQTIARVVSALLAHGRIRRGYLGVSTQAVQLPQTSAGALQQETGLLVVAVEPESPAEQSGLLLGDTIVGFNGQPVRRHDDLLALLGGEHVHQQLTVRILRGGEVTSVDVTVGER